MDHQLIDFGENIFTLINGPLSLLSITANIFYACCLTFPLRSTQRLKQPLKTLLRCLVHCSFSYWVFLGALYWVLKERIGFQLFALLWTILLCYTHSCMTCYVWLNFYYYLQIVPQQRAVLIWIKRNIRSVVYVALIFDGIFFAFSSFVAGADVLIRFPYASSGINDTWTGYHPQFHLTSQVCFSITQVHFFICLCVMTCSSFSTARYLYRHIRSMAQSGNRFSILKFKSQMTVTTTGIAQGIFFVLYYAFYIIDSFLYIFSQRLFFSLFVSFSVSSLYITSTTVTLGTGQVIFRQRAADVWRALTALCGAGMVTNDVKPHSSQLTS